MSKDVNDDLLAEDWWGEPAKFLQRVWSHHNEGFVFLSTRGPGGWKDHPIPINALDDAILRVFANFPRDRFDYYFAPNPFRKPERKTIYGLPTMFGWADIDLADPAQFRPKPNILWRTSPGRYQALWKWRTVKRPAIAQAISKKIAYEFGADQSGWDFPQVLRIPGTFNLKDAYDRPEVLLLKSDFTAQRAPRVKVQPKQVRRTKVKRFQSTKVFDDKRARKDAINVLLRHKSSLSGVGQAILKGLRNPKCMYVHAAADRSSMIWRRIRSLHKSGLSETEIIKVMWLDPYFRSKHGTNLAALEGEIDRFYQKLTSWEGKL